MEIFIDNLQDTQQVDLIRLREVAMKILRYLECQPQSELSIALVHDEEMRRLNREYRCRNQSTDVLSFAQQETIDPQLIQPYSEEASYPLPLGDVIISVETTRRQALEQHKTFEEEVYFLLIHGILHLCGYDHRSEEDAQIMEKLEHKILHTVIRDT